MKYLIFLFFFTNNLCTAQTSFNQDSLFICPPCNNSCDSLTFHQSGTCNHCGMALISKTSAIQIEKKKTKIAFYLQSGVEILDFAGPMEVFAQAGFKIYTISKTKEPIRSQGILKFVPDYDITDAPKVDVLAFFGGNGRASFSDPEVIEWIKKQQGIDYYFSVCTGVFALAESGILDGKSATTFHLALSSLESDFPKIKVEKEARFVDNGKVITTAGISAGIDGALHLVAKLRGQETAKKIAEHIEYDKWVPEEGLILSDDSPYKD